MGSMSSLRSTVSGREYPVRQIAQFFDYQHLPPELQDVSREFHDMATTLVQVLPDSAELIAGLRKLLEAKDCFVRCAVAAQQLLPVERCAVRGEHPGHKYHRGNPQGVMYQIPPEGAIEVWCRGEATQF